MNRHPSSLTQWLDLMPLVAILRGLEPERAAEYGFALSQAGLSIIEVPLNRPRALESIGALAGVLGRYVLVGAGTVMNAADVRAATDAGARRIVSPSTDPAVIAETKRRGAFSMPGFFTASEGFAALDAGADGLKLFPAEAASPAILKSLKTVLNAPILPVGGGEPAHFGAWMKAGAAGFGLGGALFKPEYSPEDVHDRAAAAVAAMRAVREGS